MEQSMQFGHFDDSRREYVIERPDTPLPWMNYLGCEDYFGIISNTGGGYSFYRDARLRRLTRYRYNNCPLDSNGRYIYVKDGDQVWNPGWKPTQTKLDHYECRHGLGYTDISGTLNQIKVSVNYFVPVGKQTEVWDVRVSNEGDTNREISLFGFVEWCLWDALDDMSNYQRNFSIGQVEVEGSAIFHKTEYRERRNHFAYFDCSRTTDGFDTSRDRFVGVHQGLDQPQAVVAGKCTGSIANGWAPIGAHQIDLKLQPGEETRFQFRMGFCENPVEEKFTSPHVINKQPYRDQIAGLENNDGVDEALSRLATYWDDRLNRYQVEIENDDVSRMVNVWNTYQCMATFNLSRSASGFESGIGRGMGFRDSNQDVLGAVHMEPVRVRQRLLDLAATQLSDGTCFHQYQPLTRQGNADIGGDFHDDPLWLVLAACAYVRETGDTDILDAKVGFADVPTEGDPSTTLLDHLELSLCSTGDRSGPHGLPLIGHADWNDCLNLNCHSTEPGESFQLAGDVEDSIAESVMIAGLYCSACENLADLYRHLQRSDDETRIQDRHQKMSQAINEHGWDGDWFLRAYDSSGAKVGSKECEEGKIFIESQGWAVLGGVGIDDGKAKSALDSVHEHLATPKGICLQQPAFSQYHANLGEITSYPPGYKENAGIFSHNNTWIQIAETILGNGQRAWDYYSSICPSMREDQSEYRSEPYVYAQMIAGPDAATFGEAKNSWLTGTASWSLVVISQYILGIRATHDGLLIDPCIPPDWKQYTVVRKFRDKTYRIHVRNPNGESRGVTGLTINGKAVNGNVIPLDLDGNEFEVEVQLGEVPVAV